MRAGLVGDDVDLGAHAEQRGHEFGRIAEHADRQRSPQIARVVRQGERLLERVGAHVEVALLDPPGDARGIDVDHDRHPVVHGDGKRLGAAHSPEAGGEGDRSGQGPAEALGRDGGEGLVCALQNALRADVDPGSGRHLAVHGQPERFEAPELVPVRPIRNQVGVRDQHPGRPLVGLHDADRLARLHQQRLVAAQRLKAAVDGGQAGVVARGLAGSAVHDELLGMLGHLRVEVVLQHAQRRLLRPAERVQLRSAVCGGHAVSFRSRDAAASRAPDSTSSTAAAISGAR